MSAEVGLLREAATRMPEPPNGAYILVGDLPSQLLYQRDDEEAANCDWGEARWFDAADGNEIPETWDELVSLKPVRMFREDDPAIVVREAGEPS